MLKSGFDPNFLSTIAAGTPLVEAIAQHEQEIFDLLLSAGADVNLGEKQGIAPLGAAAWYRDAHAVTELLKRGAKIEARNEEGYTPLLSAASRFGNLNTIKVLIAAAADIKATTAAEGQTAVMLAAQAQDFEIVNLFIDLGLDPCAHDKTGKTAVYFANFGIVDSGPRVNLRKQILKLLEDKCSSRLQSQVWFPGG